MMRSEDKDEVEIGDLVLCEKVVEDIKVKFSIFKIQVD